LDFFTNNSCNKGVRSAHAKIIRVLTQEPLF
jgi:hypothetical protein